MGSCEAQIFWQIVNTSATAQHFDLGTSLKPGENSQLNDCLLKKDFVV